MCIGCEMWMPSFVYLIVQLRYFVGFPHAFEFVFRLEDAVKVIYEGWVCGYGEEIIHTHADQYGVLYFVFVEQ